MTSPAPIPTHREPGTAHDDGITPEQYEAGRVARAAALNPAFNVDVPVKCKRGRKPGCHPNYKGGGHPPRPTRMVRGVREIWCGGCRAFHSTSEFFRRLDAFQPSCKKHNLSRGGQWKRWHEAKQAELSEREALLAKERGAE